MSEAADPRVANLMPRDARRPSLVDDGFPELFSARYAQVVRTIWFIVHDRAVAEEIAQEAFTQLYRDWVGCGLRPADLWVRRVAIRRAQREASRATRRVALERATQCLGSMMR